MFDTEREWVIGAHGPECDVGPVVGELTIDHVGTGDPPALLVVARQLARTPQLPTGWCRGARREARVRLARAARGRRQPTGPRALGRTKGQPRLVGQMVTGTSATMDADRYDLSFDPTMWVRISSSSAGSPTDAVPATRCSVLNRATRFRSETTRPAASGPRDAPRRQPRLGPDPTPESLRRGSPDVANLAGGELTAASSSCHTRATPARFFVSPGDTTRHRSAFRKGMPTSTFACFGRPTAPRPGTLSAHLKSVGSPDRRRSRPLRSVRLCRPAS